MTQSKQARYRMLLTAVSDHNLQKLLHFLRQIDEFQT